jgi:hypothetical protein
VKGFHQIPVAAQDIPKTLILTSFGLFKYLFTPFRLSNAVQTFPHMMDCSVDNLKAMFAYMDNSWVGSLDRQTHLIHLEAFLSTLAAMALPSISKNVFLPLQLWKFLGT